MKEEIYAFYSLLRHNKKHSKEYVLICTFKKTRDIAPDLTLEEFEYLIKEFTKKYYEEYEKEII